MRRAWARDPNVTVDAGVNWTEQDYPTAQFYNVFTTNHVPYHVCGAQQDNTTACVPSTGGGALYTVGGGESGYIAPHPGKLDLFFAGSYGGLLTRFDKATGTSKSINVWPENPMGHSGKDMKERFQWTFPVLISPHDNNTLYVTSQHVHRTRNAGQSWQVISPDLSTNDRSKQKISGGLTPDNAYDAVATTQPWGVDVSSGIETAPGLKDGERMRAFVSEVRRADCRPDDDATSPEGGAR